MRSVTGAPAASTSSGSTRVNTRSGGSGGTATGALQRPGALGHEDSAAEESFSVALEGAPEYPHYTRPADWRGWTVPEVLLSGHHARIRQWRLDQARARDEAGGGKAGPPLP